MWSEAGVEIPIEVADRANRTGPSYTDENSNVECKSVIVRFTTFRHRIMVYRAKKKMKPGLRVKLDLMESRYTLLTDDSKVVKQNPDIKFGYADISCRLKIKQADESIDEKIFSSVVELQEVLCNQLDVDKRKKLSLSFQIYTVAYHNYI